MTEEEVMEEMRQEVCHSRSDYTHQSPLITLVVAPNSIVFFHGNQ